MAVLRHAAQGKGHEVRGHQRRVRDVGAAAARRGRLTIPASRWAAVLGSPIGHSLSPVLRRAAYDALGLDWAYDARECTADELPTMVKAAAADPAWGGFSL